MNDKIVTSIDLGSNSFRILQYDFANDKVIGEFETTVGTAEGLTKTGKISDEAVQRVIKAIETAKDKIDFNPSEAIAVTTSAMRQASNSKEVLESIVNSTGVKFKIIDGDTEADYTLKGLQYSLYKKGMDSSNIILVDIGGGSTELIFVKDGNVSFKSFEIGIVTLTQSENPLEVLNNYKAKMDSYVNSLGFDLNNLKLIATAGTPTTIAALKHNLNYSTYDKNIINGTTVTISDLDYYKNFLLSISLEEAEFLTGTNRSQYIARGIDIFKMLYEVLAKTESIVFDEGLREGVAVNWFYENFKGDI